MLVKPLNRLALATIVCVTIAPARQSAAITTELAKTCNALTQLAFPPRQPGNPAVGSDKGSGSERAAYFKQCIANGGKMDGAGGTSEAGGTLGTPKR